MEMQNYFFISGDQESSIRELHKSSLEIVLKPGPTCDRSEYMLGIVFPASAFYISLVSLLVKGIETHPRNYG